jgi:benzaldehyde dehydrogenase (NAD)
MAAFDQEIFGPVIAVTTFGTDQEAAELANATGFGLVAAVHTGSVSRGMRLASRLRTGMGLRGSECKRKQGNDKG